MIMCLVIKVNIENKHNHFNLTYFRLAVTSDY